MKIATIAPLRYSPGRLEYFQFIRGGVGADYHQNPGFHQFADGLLRMAWGAYDFDECSPNCVTLYSDSCDRGLTWSDPQVYMADYPAGPLGGPVLILRGGREAIMYLVQTRHEIQVDEASRVATAGSDYFTARSHVYVRRSTDGGHTFDHGRELPWQEITGGKGLQGGGMYYGDVSLVQLESGRILAAGDFLDPARADPGKGSWEGQHFTGVCMISDDGGQSWWRSGEITVDTPRGVMEPRIVEVAPDRLLCLFRIKGGYLYPTTSDDGGETWSASEPSPLTAPESMCQLIKLRSGNLLVVWNNVSSTNQQPRYPLVAAVSRDGGETWGPPLVIATETVTNQLSNHGIIQLDDGRILLGISHYRDVRPMTSDLDMAIFDEEWLNAGAKS
ncbi:MAG: exo-alpha-sialidase [Armatimonadetes bacterium]|nr:exo-alpha-sialidase [Armatimonadota bacterium]